jgi:hypothetical protein
MFNVQLTNKAKGKSEKAKYINFNFFMLIQLVINLQKIKKAVPLSKLLMPVVPVYVINSLNPPRYLKEVLCKSVK